MPLAVRPLVFRGLIVKTNGLIANIPLGFQLCDGTNGTPDLRAKFVKGVLTNATNPGTTGGEDSHVLTTAELPVHTHSITETAHLHTFVPYTTVNAQPPVNVGTLIQPRSGNAGTNTSAASLAGVSVGNTGGGLSHENRPAFFEVLYIMKVRDW